MIWYVMDLGRVQALVPVVIASAKYMIALVLPCSWPLHVPDEKAMINKNMNEATTQRGLEQRWQEYVYTMVVIS